ncbi:MAG TPA: hypothetical protein VHW64_18150 [Nocardioides sp.]|jgi:hypothetical protein|uniref:hypothetical protein n=1 Tax=Nocardioides sp. TaxID=35761 RepID=UPI002E2F85E5|nr:hypothetical protein [Nocardioides sp.]HEX3932624.1 hypothetical protein [Nocardioides sp.]
MSNLTIANILLFFAILCLALSFEVGLYLYFIYSIAAVAMAGALRYQLLPDDQKSTRRR